MRANIDVLAIVLAGGHGSRLQPLTTARCKPAVPFEGGHRIVDFVLSNLVNSGISAIHVLAQYRSKSLLEHLSRSWTASVHGPSPVITIVTPRTTEPAASFKGTADAVFQNIHLIESIRPAVVAVFGADHVYRMDVRQMVDFHLRRRADATVATVPVLLGECSNFGIVEADARGRIRCFHEKPVSVAPMRGSHTHALASMGNYVFNAEVLVAALRSMHAAGCTDFGAHLLPSMVNGYELMAYDFAKNHVPGVDPCEERAYWRDVGTLDAYYQTCIDTRAEKPRFVIDNPAWPVHGRTCAARETAPAGLEPDLSGGNVVLDDSRIRAGALVRRAIIDSGNDVPCGERIGFDLVRDRERFKVSAGGVVVVPAGYFPFGLRAEQSRDKNRRRFGWVPEFSGPEVADARRPSWTTSRPGPGVR